MSPWTRFAVLAGKTALVLIAVPGCHLIATFDTSQLAARSFRGGCYQNLGALPGMPVGVIVIDSRGSGDTVAGRGSGVFARGDWTFAEIDEPNRGVDSARIEILFEDGSNEIVRITESGDGIRFEDLPLDESSLDMSPCLDTPGIYHLDTRQIFLWNTLLEEAPEVAETYDVVTTPDTRPGPVGGDWDGDGTDSYGLYDPRTSTFHLHGDSPEDGDLEIVLASIPPGLDVFPVAGDWDGDGRDGVGVYIADLHRFHLFENADPERRVTPFEITAVSDTGVFPVAGNWDGIGGDSVGIWQLDRRELRFVNLNAGSAAEITCSPAVTFDATQPVAGDWTAAGSDGLGLYQRSTGSFLFYRIDAASGSCTLLYELHLADAVNPRYLPVAGNWDGR